MTRHCRVYKVLLVIMIAILCMPALTLAQEPTRGIPADFVDYPGVPGVSESVEHVEALEDVDILELRPATQVPRDGYELHGIGDNPYCLRVNTGTLRTTWRIENPAGIGSIPTAHYANYDQNVISQSSTTVVLELISRADLSSSAPYPVQGSVLPSEVLVYLDPETMAQSDDPEILALASQLVQGSQSQTEAVERIHAWVGSQISYDYTLQLPNDAKSVFIQRAGVCSGYSWLTVALLRAAGIPARYTVGCVNWMGDQGALHAWVETYYPDAGWALSEPQESANYLHSPGYVVGLLGMCGASGTTVTQLSIDNSIQSVVTLETAYLDEFSPLMNAASIFGLPRTEVSAIPARDMSTVSLSDPVSSLDIQIKNNRCRNEDWRVESGSSWLHASSVEGLADGIAHVEFSVDVLEPGEYQAQFNVYASRWDFEPAGSVSHTIRVTDDTVSLPSISVELTTGWNLIGIPFAPSAPQIIDFVQPLSGKVESVLAWDAVSQSWQRFTPSAPSYSNSLSMVGAGQALWVKMSASAIFQIQSSNAQSTDEGIALQPGWNMISLCGQSAMDLEDAMASIEGQYSSVLAYGSDPSPTWYRYDVDVDPALNTLSVLEPGRGYWIWASSNCLWTLP